MTTAAQQRTRANAAAAVARAEARARRRPEGTDDELGRLYPYVTRERARQIRLEIEASRAAVHPAPVVPARITLAFWQHPNAARMAGPWVDKAVGTWENNPAGDVDDWEAGLAVPTPAQIALLATFLEVPPAWFYRPIEPGPLFDGPLWITHATGRGRRCERVDPAWVDDRGVLHHTGEEPPLAARQTALF